jgi:hypothetical protein
MKKTTRERIGRLAFREVSREDGDWWHAYYARDDTMQDAQLLGTILLKLVKRPDRKDRFMALMRLAFSDMVEDVAGVRPTWPEPPQPAPEHERVP